MINKFKKASVIFSLILLSSSCNNDDDCKYTECKEDKVINISTGIDSNLDALAIGAVDSNWNVASSPYPVGTPALNSSTYTVWQPTPVATTNAGWINCTGANCCANLPGDYVFERPFTIPSGTYSFTCNFEIAQDDVLVSAELVAPDGTITSLTVLPTTPYQLSLPITDTLTNPLSGSWKLRVKVNFIDVGAAFLASGYINATVPCVD